MNNTEKLEFLLKISYEYDHRELTGAETDELREILSDSDFWRKLIDIAKERT